MSPHHAAPAHSRDTITCQFCGHTFPRSTAVALDALQPALVASLLAQHPAWDPAGYLCIKDLNEARAQYVLAELAAERGELGAIETEVARQATQHLSIARNIQAQMEHQATRGELAADAVAKVGGSWGFVIGFAIFIAVWMTLNVLALRNQGFDPYPFILLNLVLSTLAAIQAPIIMMSQNRLSARDRLEADEDFRINLKSELEIASLHAKIDHLLHAQWERMATLQQIEIDLLTELATHRKPGTPPDAAAAPAGHTT